ncbi:hypothetical protein BC835DRAFT_1408473 [Cytidiella melzeri]|nr:hypothetical protein BC835DRAFT_1408473 [Cytidiella melzeri]
MSLHRTGDIDYYALLSIPPSATTAEVKMAYHRALLKHHPDKHSLQHRTESHGLRSDIGLLKTAHQILITPELRAKYDARRAAKASPPRPAQVVSLEEFTELEDDLGWAYNCRCSGVYAITEQEMERGQHLVGCSSCSEVVWVGYEAADEDQDAGKVSSHAFR